MHDEKEHAETEEGTPKEQAPDEEQDIGMEEHGEIVEEREASEEEDLGFEEQLAALNDKYVRLYAEFENYKKRVQKEKGNIMKYAQEVLLHELMPSLDHLEIALKHAEENEASDGLKQGVDMTLRELHRSLEKVGLKTIDALGKTFDPKYHHAMSVEERDDVDEQTVVEVLRTGYVFHDKVLRAAMVTVSKRPGSPVTEDQAEAELNDTEEIEEISDIEEDT